MTRSEQYSFLQDLGNTSPIWPVVGAEQRKPESYCYLVRPYGKCRDWTQFQCWNFPRVIDTCISLVEMRPYELNLFSFPVWSNLIFQPIFLSQKNNWSVIRPGVTADLDPPLPNFPLKHRLYHIWWLILFASFLSMFFSITTQYSSIKVKKTAISFQFCRIY